MSKWNLTYAVQCDFRPYQEWIVEAESESEARLMVAQQLGVPYEETDAAIKHEQNTQFVQINRVELNMNTQQLNMIITAVKEAND